MASFAKDFTPIARAFMPTTNWAVRRGEMDQNLAYQQAQVQIQQQEQAKNELLIRQQQELDRAISQLPFYGPDLRKRDQFRNEQMNRLAKRIETDYGGDAEKFLKAEGQSSVQERLSEFMGSDVYKTGIQNAQSLMLAQQAAQKGELLVGSMDEKGKYTTGEEEMAQFYAGLRDRFQFRRSYKSDTGKIYDYFGKMDNPTNKYDASATVPQQEIVNYLRGTHDPLIAADMMARNHVPSNVPYKRYSLQDALKFEMDIKKDAQSMDYQKAQMGLAGLRAQKLKNEMAGGADGNGRTWVDILASDAMTTPKTAFVSKKGEDYTINTLGKKLSDYAGNGSLEFLRLPIPNEPMQKAVKGMSGVEPGGQVSEMIFADNGGYVLPLSKVPHRVISVDGNIYTPQQELAGLSQKQRADGFIKVRVAMSEDAAERLDLYDTDFFNEDTAKGQGKYTRNPENSSEMIFEGYVPVKGLISSQLLNLYGTKGAMGQKYVTESIDDFGIEF